MGLWRWLSNSLSRWRERAGVRGLFSGLAAAGAATVAPAAVLPDDKAEAMFHVYDGGGVKADGPAFLVRKKLGERVSLSAGYYIDAVSNASIDVVTTASPFKEKRTAWDFGADWLVGGLGDDSYGVDNAGDRTLEAADEGYDTVFASLDWALVDGLEALVLTGLGKASGLGNGLNNSLLGNDGKNSLRGGDGDDLINGQAAEDRAA